jgi:hypothetical protein
MQSKILHVWWTGIDHTFCTFQQLKQRQVVAQGVPALGTLIPLFKFMDDEAEFRKQIVQLGDLKHTGIKHHWWFENRDSNIRKIPLSMFNLLSLSTGDLVVALEGTAVKGICQIEKDALDSYEFQASYNYAHSVGYPVKWMDWTTRIFGRVPTPPGQSVYGIRGLSKEKEYVISCWSKVQSK